MKQLLLGIFLISRVSVGFSQTIKVTVVNDTTELQEYISGEKLKVNFKLNDRILTIMEKDKLLIEHPGIQQTFNIKTIAGKLAGEVNFTIDDLTIQSAIEKVTEKSTSGTLDISDTPTGRLFPGFTWKDINANEVSLKELKGKTVVLNFWHTSCVPCIAEMPLLNRLVAKYSTKGVVFVSATPNTGQELSAFLNKRKFEYRHFAEVDTKTIFSPFPGWPIHVVLNAESVIQFACIGKQSNIEEKLIGVIDKSLEGK